MPGILDWFNKPSPVMACPFCRQPMTAKINVIELHIDSSGRGMYECLNAGCDAKPKYRRADVVEEAQKLQEDSRASMQAVTNASFIALNADMNNLTTWIRDRYPELLKGQFKSIVDVAVHIMSGGKEGETKPLSGKREPGEMVN